jgi:hypothetical protein
MLEDSSGRTAVDATALMKSRYWGQFQERVAALVRERKDRVLRGVLAAEFGLH